jgi:hypothetical protein
MGIEMVFFPKLQQFLPHTRERQKRRKKVQERMSYGDLLLLASSLDNTNRTFFLMYTNYFSFLLVSDVSK